MPTFTIQAPDGRNIDIQAPDQDTAVQGAQQWVAANPMRNVTPSAAPTPNPAQQRAAAVAQAKQVQPQAQGLDGVFDTVAGALANVNRGLGVGDEAAAALNTGIGAVQDAMAGKKGPDIVTRFQNSMKAQRAVEDGFAAQHPVAADLAKGTGMAATMLVPAGEAAQVVSGSRLANAARGATTAGLTAAGYGLVDRGAPADRLAAASAAARNPAVLALGAGAGAGALAPATGAATDDAAADASVPSAAAISRAKTLQQAGVSLTPGQAIGGLAKGAEDLAQRAPILGMAIRGARARGVVSLNRAVANQALAPIGEALPASVAAGHAAVQYVADRLGQQYDDAAAMIPQIAPDPEFKTALAAIGKSVSELPTDVGAQYQSILDNRLAPLQSGPVSGQQFGSIQSQIAKLAADRGASSDAAQRSLGDMLESVSDAMKDTMARFSPEAGSKINAANQGWANFVRLRSAASKAADGIFTPGQLSTAVRTMDKSVGKGNVAKGQAVLQNLSSAASSVMPDKFGNPGTADALGLGALGTSVVTAPHVGVPMAAGLTAAATPYFMMGRRIVSQLGPSTTPAQLQNAAQQLDALVAKDPTVVALRDAVSRRLARTVGVAGAAAQGSGANRNATPVALAQ